MTALLLVPDPERSDAAGLAAVAASVQAGLGAVAAVFTDLAAVVSAGHRDVVAIALVTATAGFDPAVLRVALQRGAPDAHITVARALGPHPSLVQLTADRVQDAAPTMDQADVAVLLVGSGSVDPQANADLVKVARLLQEGRAYQFVEVAYLRHTRPSVRQGLERCAALGAVRVVVVPYLLLGSACAAEVEVGPGAAVAMAGPLGDSPLLTALIVERFYEARHGDLRSNCDVCSYRELHPHGSASHV